MNDLQKREWQTAGVSLNYNKPPVSIKTPLLPFQQARINDPPSGGGGGGGGVNKGFKVDARTRPSALTKVSVTDK